MQLLDWEETLSEEFDTSAEEVLARLLDAEVLFMSARDDKIALYVLANDVFAWACADAEAISPAELPDLWRMYQADNQFGAERWLCVKRNQKPQPPLEQMMRDAGSWDAVMDALPENENERLRNAVA